MSIISNTTCLYQYQSGINKGKFCSKLTINGDKYCSYCMKTRKPLQRILAASEIKKRKDDIEEEFATLTIEEKQNHYKRCKYFGGTNLCVVSSRDKNACCYGHAIKLSTLSDMKLDGPQLSSCFLLD